MEPTLPGNLDIISYLFTVAPVVGVMGWFIYLLIKEKKDLREYILTLQARNDQATIDYKVMAENAIKIITLADDKLKKQDSSNDQIKEIHRMVSEISDSIKHNLKNIK